LAWIAQRGFWLFSPLRFAHYPAKPEGSQWAKVNEGNLNQLHALYNLFRKHDS